MFDGFELFFPLIQGHSSLGLDSFLMSSHIFKSYWESEAFAGRFAGANPSDAAEKYYQLIMVLFLT